MSTRQAALISCLIVWIGAAGCATESHEEKPPTSAQLVTNFKELLQEYQKRNNKAPKSPKELEEADLFYDWGMWLLRNDKIVYAWGVPIASTGSDVIAYEPAVPQEGGEVILQDGTVKTMSAEEFAVAPKAAFKK